jgi:hypothetical protein
VKALRNAPQVKAVYDMTLAYAHYDRFMEAPSFWNTVACGDLGSAGYRFYIRIDRYDLHELPHDDDKLGLWLEERWIEKDRRLKELRVALDTGNWPVN